MSYLHKYSPAIPEKGVISYELVPIDKQWKPSPVPVTVPSSVWDRIDEIIELMKNATDKLATAIAQLNFNKDLIPWVILGCAGAGAIIVVVSTSSGGSLAPAAAPLAYYTGILFVAAMSIDTGTPPPIVP